MRVYVEDHAESVVLRYENGKKVNLTRIEDFDMNEGESLWICDIPEDGEYTLIAKSKTQQSTMTFALKIENGQRAW